MKKKITCFALSVILCINMIVPAFANQDISSAVLSENISSLVNNPVVPDSSAVRVETQKIELDRELNAWMIINIYSNATSDFFLIQDNEVLTSAHLNKLSHEILETRYLRGKITSQSKISYTPLSSTPATRTVETRQNNNVGTIGYRGYSQGYAAGTVYLRMGYLWESGTNGSYTFVGNYDSIATMVALISGYFSMPESGAAPLINAFMSCLGLAATIVGIVFATAVTVNNVDWFRYTWTGTNPHATSQKATIAGEKYQATFPDGTSWVDYKGSYYTVSNYTTRDVAFAEAFFWKVFNYYEDCDVVSWS